MVKMIYERKVRDKLETVYTIYGERDVIHYIIYKLQRLGRCMIHKHDDEEGEYIILNGKSFLDYSDQVEKEFDYIVKLIGDIVKSYENLKRKETKLIVIYYNNEE